MFSPHPLRNPRPRHDRKKRACLKAARTAAEKLESRVLLDSVLETAILHALPPQERGNFAPNGALVLSYARQPHAMAPTYSLLDAQPSLDAQGKLSPFATTGPTGILPAALRHAYGIDQIKFGSVVGNGAGQTIAIIDAYDYPTALSDLQAFDRALGLPDPPSFKKVNQSGGSTLPGVDPAGAGHDWETEEALDIQWAHAIAPAANIIRVECNSAYNSDLLDAGVNWARSAPGVSAVSMSFGAPEWATETSEDGLFTTPAGHRGVTFLAASGDKGGFADYPAYSPNVVAVGGTSLTVDGSGNYQSEMAWFGSGGGISAYESQPAFQKGVVTQSTSRRTIPDVAFDADPNTGVPVYDSYDFGAATPWAQFGGTSLSAPCWAGLIAIANQNRALGGATSLNGATTILPRLYASAAGNFHDITTGGGFGGYAAAAGYDLITGLGTPLANLLVPHLSAYGPYVTGVSPVGLQSAAPTSIGFNFNMPINPATFSIASDVVSFTGPGGQNLLSQIKGFTWLNNNSTLQVNFAAPSAEGPYRMTIGPNILSASGAPMDQNQNGLNAEGAFDQFTGIVQYDKNPLTVASTTPAAGSTIAAPFTTITLHFNRPYDRNTAGVNNLSLSQGAVSAYSCIGAQTISYTLSGITLAGAIVVSMPFGALNDTCGNPMLAFSAQYNIPVPPAPGMPALLAASDTAPSASPLAPL